MNARALVLIPGAWSGPWVWEPVRLALTARGHDVRVVTLSGLEPGEDIASIGLDSHVQDVEAVLEAEDLREVVLVGHSYSGMVAGQVADRVPERVARTVYVQAFLPIHGESLLDAFPAGAKAAELETIDRHGGRWPAPTADEIAREPDISDEQARSLAERMVAHPGRTVSEPAVLARPLAEQRATWVASSMDAHGIDRVENSSRWTFVTIDAGHWPMLTQPERLADLLATAASLPTSPLGPAGRGPG